MSHGIRANGTYYYKTQVFHQFHWWATLFLKLRGWRRSRSLTAPKHIGTRKVYRNKIYSRSTRDRIYLFTVLNVLFFIFILSYFILLCMFVILKNHTTRKPYKHTYFFYYYYIIAIILLCTLLRDTLVNRTTSLPRRR